MNQASGIMDDSGSIYLSNFLTSQGSYSGHTKTQGSSGQENGGATAS